MILKNEGRALSQMNRVDEAKLMAANLFRSFAKQKVNRARLTRRTGGDGESFITEPDYAGAEIAYRQAIAIFRRLHAQTPLFALVFTALAYDLILQTR